MGFIRYSTIFLALTLVATFTTPIAAATKKKASKPASATPWNPTPFPSSSTSLPANYSGLNATKVWALFKSRAQSFEKSDYETTEDFQRRLESSSGSLSPLLADTEYAFLLKGVTIKYDADNQKYDVSDYIFCEKTSDYGNSKGWATCKVSELSRERSQYVGSNAYGAKASIDKTYGKDFAVAVPTDSNFFYTDLFRQDNSQYRTIFELKSSFSIPIEKAKSIQNFDIGMLLVGKFSKALIVEGRATLIDPTISKPRDIFITVDAVPFTPTRVVYYVLQTGEILSAQDL